MNIQQLLIELKKTGLTDKQIGSHVGAAQSIITRLRNGFHSSTTYERGMAIRKLYKERCLDSPSKPPEGMSPPS